ncbi:MAG: hypothetical protein ACU84H_07595 [Gammaproteobacteria bacterium]
MPKKNKNIVIPIGKALVWSAVLSLMTLCKADENNWLPDSIQIHGFLSQGFLHTSDNNFFGESDDSISTDFRELGLNGSWKIMSDLQVAMQVVYRNAGDTDDSDFRIDYGVANYNLFSSESSLLSLRGGRVPTPLGLYNDTRDVAATRPSILLPQSIYFDRNRNLALSADGGYIYGEHRTDYGDFSLNLGTVIPRTDDPDFNQNILRKLPGQMEGDVSWVGRMGYDWRNGLVKLAITFADFNSHNEGSDVSTTTSRTFKFNPLILSAQYSAENWSLTSEWALRRTKIGTYNSPVVDFTGQSFYFQGTYRIIDSLEALVRYDELIWDLDDKHGDRFEEMTGLPNYSRFAQDWTFGLRYEILPSLLLSGEYHRVNGTGWLSNLENPNGTTQHWDLFAMMISYNF